MQNFSMSRWLFIMLSGLLLAGSNLEAQTPNCDWITVTKGTFCHPIGPPDGDSVYRCRNIEEPCCVYNIDINNVFDTNIVYVDLCSSGSCLDTIRRCWDTNFVFHICEYCGTNPVIRGTDISYGFPWPEDSLCRRLVAAVGDTLGDGEPDSLCKANCLHVKAPTMTGLPEDSTLRIRAGFTGIGIPKCVTVCVTLADGTKECCAINFPPCSGGTGVPNGSEPPAIGHVPFSSVEVHDGALHFIASLPEAGAAHVELSDYYGSVFLTAEQPVVSGSNVIRLPENLSRDKSYQLSIVMERGAIVLPVSFEN